MMQHVCGVLLVGFVMGALQPGLAAAIQTPREVPANVAIHDLIEDPDRYDGQRVVVSGVISSIVFERGRRGSEYAVIMLEESVTSAPPSTYAVKVISLTMPNVGRCQQALVQGVYHREGRQAGRSYELFIDADAVVQGDPSESGLVPSVCEERL